MARGKQVAEKVKKLLKTAEFLDVATTDGIGQPNAAPKFLLKFQGSKLYMVDCIMGRTWKNIKVNNRVSLPLMDTDTLLGYRINGRAYIVEEGGKRRKLAAELLAKQIKLSTARIVEGIRQERQKRNLEVHFPEIVGIFVIDIESIVEIGPTGRLARHELKKEAA